MGPPALILLVVDDDPHIRGLVHAALEDEGYRVALAPHGAAALAWLRESPDARPAAILLDLNMPVMDGREFARAYRRLPSPPGGAPLLVMTAARDMARRCAEVGADGCLAKPFELDALIELVAAHAARRAAA